MAALTTRIWREMTGIGAVTAAVIMTVWSQPRADSVRGRSDSDRGNLSDSGVIGKYDPTPTQPRWRPPAINTIVLTRMRMDPDTCAYMQRRSAEGRTPGEITRCLKRYLTRQIHRTLAAGRTTQEVNLAT